MKLQKRTILTALVAADYKDDRDYVLRKVRGLESYCIDGLFHFRLQGLKKRWDEIIEYIPVNMSEVGIDSFIGFLIEDGEGKVFLKNGADRLAVACFSEAKQLRDAGINAEVYFDNKKSISGCFYISIEN